MGVFSLIKSIFDAILSIFKIASSFNQSKEKSIPRINRLPGSDMPYSFAGDQRKVSVINNGGDAYEIKCKDFRPGAVELIMNAGSHDFWFADKLKTSEITYKTSKKVKYRQKIIFSPEPNINFLNPERIK